MRRGVVVISYREGLPSMLVAQLHVLQSAVPAGTIVTPNGTGMRFDVAAIAWGALLGCPRFNEGVIDAVRLFHGRHLGRGPDREG